MVSITVPVFRMNVVLSAIAPEPKIIAASVIVGSSAENELTVTATGLGTAAFPGYVFLQARQNDDIEHGFPDVFGLQVIRVTDGDVTFRIKRLDGTEGWGQELQVDILHLPFAAIT